jgi:hypothetical protein
MCPDFFGANVSSRLSTPPDRNLPTAAWQLAAPPRHPFPLHSSSLPRRLARAASLRLGTVDRGLLAVIAPECAISTTNLIACPSFSHILDFPEQKNGR